MTTHATSVRLAELDCLTPLGNRGATHGALVAGHIALRPVPVLGRQGGDPVPLALRPGRDLDESVPPVWLADLLNLAAPIRDQGWGRPRRPVCFASSNFGVGSLYEYQLTGDRAALPYGTPTGCVEWIRHAFGWGPHGATISHACASAHLALLHASRLVQAGVADEVLVFAFDFLSPFVAGGFHALKILNAAMPAPFRARDTGAIGLGDGAAYAVVTRHRGEFEIVAQSVHNEMYHFTANEPAGAGFAAVLAPLVQGRSNLWYKGHGTGTLEAGRLECQAVASLLPDAPIVGWKGSLGHTLGSSGLVELALAAQAIATGVTPGTLGAAGPTFVPQVAEQSFANRSYDGALCASNAFGGAQAALILRHV